MSFALSQQAVRGSQPKLQINNGAQLSYNASYYRRHAKATRPAPTTPDQHLRSSRSPDLFHIIVSHRDMGSCRVTSRIALGRLHDVGRSHRALTDHHIRHIDADASRDPHVELCFPCRIACLLCGTYGYLCPPPMHVRSRQTRTAPCCGVPSESLRPRVSEGVSTQSPKRRRRRLSARRPRGRPQRCAPRGQRPRGAGRSRAGSASPARAAPTAGKPM